MSDPSLVVRVAANLADFRANFSEGVIGQIETSKAALSSMSTAFDGSKIINQAGAVVAAIGGVENVTTLTAAEQQRANAILDAAIIKYEALGKEAPAAMLALRDATAKVPPEVDKISAGMSQIANYVAASFTVGAVVAFGEKVLDAGDQIMKMSEQTGFSIEQVQRLQFVASQTGVSIEALVSATQNLQQRLGDDSTGAAAAMKRLGINTEDFLKLDTYSQLTSISDAIAAVHDPTQRAADGAAIFGKTWKEILPAIIEGIRQIGNEAPVMADSTVKSLDRVGDAMKRAQLQSTAWGGAVVLAIEGAGFAVGDFLSRFNPEHFGVATSQILALYGALNDETGVAGALSKLQPITLATAKATDDFSMSASALKLAIDDSNIALEKQIADEKALAAAQAQADQIAMNRYENQIKRLDEVTQATLKAYGFGAQIAALTQLDQAEQELAKSVYASLNSEKDRAKVIEESITRHIALMNEEMTVQNKQKDLVNAAVVAEFEATRTLNAGYYDQKTALDRLNDALDLLHAKKVDGISQTAQETLLEADYTKAVNDEAAALNDAAIARNKDTETVKANTLAKQAAAQMFTVSSQFSLNPNSSVSLSDQAAAKGGTVAYDSNNNPYAYVPGVNLPSSRDTGGPVSAGQAYYVGTGAQPELFVPQSAGTMIPAGAGGPSITNHIYVTQPLGTPSAIADAVGEAVMQKLRSQGVRLPSGA